MFPLFPQMSHSISRNGKSAPDALAVTKSRAKTDKELSMQVLVAIHGCLQECTVLRGHAWICTFDPFFSKPASLSQLSMTPDLEPRIDTTVNA